MEKRREITELFQRLWGPQWASGTNRIVFPEPIASAGGLASRKQAFEPAESVIILTQHWSGLLKHFDCGLPICCGCSGNRE